jgi:hypothetical protein
MQQIRIDLGLEEEANEADTSSESGENTNSAEKSVDRSEISVQVLNGAKKAGIAGEMKKQMESMGYSNVKVGDTKDMTYGYTRVIDRCGNQEKLQKVAQDMKIDIVESDIDINCGYDITIIIGKDRINGGM